MELSIIAEWTDNSSYASLNYLPRMGHFMFCIEISLCSLLIHRAHFKPTDRSCFLYEQVQTIMSLIVELCIRSHAQGNGAKFIVSVIKSVGKMVAIVKGRCCCKYG